jgi:hypothetical protein
MPEARGPMLDRARLPVASGTMTQSIRRLAPEMTKEEEEFGFGVAEEPSGTHAVVRALPAGLRAMKVLTEEGTTEYAICDAQLRPLYRPAKSLDELRKRFGPLPA